jgi:DegV family protein with EDD domain
MIKEKIALIIDSMADLPQELVNRLGMKVIPARVIYPEGEYRDRVDIMPEEVYQRMPGEIPKTSVPSLQDIRQTIDHVREEGFTHAIALHISGALSGTAQAVQLISRDVQDLKIRVIDSKTLSMGTGWVALDAARQIANGVRFDAIVERIQNLQSRVHVYYILETLEYLRRGGRIGKVAGMLGEFLHLKPIISVNEAGEYFTYCKVRGRLKSIDKLVEIVEKAVQEKEINLAIMHGGALKDFEKVVERLRSLPNIKELITSDISPTLGVHTGPGLIGVSFYEV